MTLASPSRSSSSRRSSLRPLGVRAIALASLLAAELVTFGLVFDAGDLPGRSGLWSTLLVRTPRAIAVLIAVAAATGLLAGKPLWNYAADAFERSRDAHRWKAWLLIHWVIAGSLYATTSRLFAQAEDGVAPSRASTLLWLGLVAGMLASWALALLPAGLWTRLAWRGRRAALAGAPLGAAAWLAAWASGRIGWKFLGNGTIKLVHELLVLFYPETVYDLSDMSVGTPDFAVSIDATCSGYQGIGLICVFLAAYLWLFRSRLRFPRALLLLPLGVASIWLANILRIFLLIVIGASGWPDIAQGGFHSQAGWLAFNAVALGFVAFAGNSRYLNADASPDRSARGSNATAAYLAPFLGMVVTAMLTAVVARGIDWYYPLRLVVAGALLFAFRRSYGDLRWNFSWRPFLVGAGMFCVWVGLVPGGPGGPGSLDQLLSSFESAPAWLTAGWLALRMTGYVVVVPIVEELAFRGYLLRRLVSSDFQSVRRDQLTWAALIVSALLFGALHGRNWLPGSAAGLAFGAAFWQRGKVADAAIAHAVVNGLIAGYAFATGDWRLWG